MCQCAGASITILGYLSAANWLTKNQHCGTKKIKGKVWFLTLNLIFIIQTNFTAVRLGDIFQLSFRLFSHLSTSTYVWCRSLQGCKYKIIFIKNCCSFKSIVILMKNELSKIWNVLKRKNQSKEEINARGIGTHEESALQFSKIYVSFGFIYQYYVYTKYIILNKHSVSLENCFELSAIQFILHEYFLQCNFMRKIGCTSIIICSDMVFVIIRLSIKH